VLADDAIVVAAVSYVVSVVQQRNEKAAAWLRSMTMIMNRMEFEGGLNRLPYRVATLNRSGIGVAVNALSDGGDDTLDVFVATFNANWKKVVKQIFVLTTEALNRLATAAMDAIQQLITNTVDAIKKALCQAMQWLTGETCPT
jgi:hypothetical protein